jgi:hypothetical protein
VATYAQLGDVEAATGKPIPVEAAHDVEELLDEAEVQLAAYAGDLAERVIAELTTAERLRSAVVGMVTRVLRQEEERSRLAAGTSTGEERAALSRWLTVTRRERMLAGIPTAAWAVSVSDSDSTLRRPTRPALPRREGSRLWR